jgi:hypothetical protein
MVMLELTYTYSYVNRVHSDEIRVISVLPLQLAGHAWSYQGAFFYLRHESPLQLHPEGADVSSHSFDTGMRNG